MLFLIALASTLTKEWTNATHEVVSELPANMGVQTVGTYEQCLTWLVMHGHAYGDMGDDAIRRVVFNTADGDIMYYHIGSWHSFCGWLGYMETKDKEYNYLSCVQTVSRVPWYMVPEGTRFNYRGRIGTFNAIDESMESPILVMWDGKTFMEDEYDNYPGALTPEEWEASNVIK